MSGFSQIPGVVRNGIMFSCSRCQGSFDSARGLGVHRSQYCNARKRQQLAGLSSSGESEEVDEEADPVVPLSKTAKLERRVRVLGKVVQFLLSTHIQAAAVE